MKAIDRIFWLAVATLAMLPLVGCAEHGTTGLPPAEVSTDPVIFDDDFNATDFHAFEGSYLESLDIDTTTGYESSASLKVTVPSSDQWAGGAFSSPAVRDLSGYNALTFYAKASQPMTFNEVGMGIDVTDTADPAPYQVALTDVPLSGAWKKVIIPIPLPAKLDLESGFFYYSDGDTISGGYTVWFDDVEYEALSTVTNPRPTMTARTIDTFAGAVITAQDPQVTFDVETAKAVEEITVGFKSNFLTFVSSVDTVVQGGEGRATAVGGGTATVSAQLGDVPVEGTITVNVTPSPDEPAPTPTVAAADVISLFSDAYTDVNVDTWHANWGYSTGAVQDYEIDGNAVKAYTELNFAGIELVNEPQDVSAMTHFHVDVWVPEGIEFKIKLVDFGANGIYGPSPSQPNDDREHELTFDADSTPAFAAGVWNTLDIPLADFTNLISTEHIAQLVISSGDAATAFVDNVYFHR